MTFLIVIATIAGLIGLFSLTKVTLGVGLIAFACLIAILARIAQAGYHREKSK